MEIFDNCDSYIADLMQPDFQIPIVKYNYPPIQNDDLSCPICHNLLQIPIVLPNCYHTFCKSCLDEWIQNQGQTCPLCRLNLNKAKDSVEQMRLTLVDLNTKFLIDSMNMNCEHCQMEIQVKDFQTHKCQIKCPDCASVTSDLVSHKVNICRERKILCPFNCSLKVKASQIQEHLSKCEFAYSECKQCHGIYQNYQVHQCQVTVCPNTILGCPTFGDHDCQFKFKLCSQCFEFHLKEHDCKKILITQLVKEYQKQVLQDDSKSICASQSLLIFCDLVLNKDKIFETLSYYGPIICYKEYMDFKGNGKKVAIRFAHSRYLNSIQLYLQLHPMFSKIKIRQLQTKEDSMKCLVLAEDLSLKDKSQVMATYKAQAVNFLSSNTDWKKGIMKFTYVMQFKNKEEADKVIQQHQFKPYAQYKPQKVIQYNLDPYQK